MMKREDIGALIEKYLDGDTTNAEEHLLREYFGRTAQADMPDEWRVYRALFAWQAAGLSAACASDEAVAPSATSSAAPETVQTATVIRHMPLARRINAFLASAAASTVILIGLSLWHTAQPEQSYYAVIDGRGYTDRAVAESVADEALALVSCQGDDAFDALTLMKEGNE